MGVNVQYDAAADACYLALDGRLVARTAHLAERFPSLGVQLLRRALLAI